VDHFLNETTNLAANVLSCPKADGANGDIILPGQLEVTEKSKRMKSGLSLDEGTWSQLKELAQKYKVSLPDSVPN
jgi:LDH2 family malate/lactate/ureidoglycolate dehydrogenase